MLFPQQTVKPAPQTATRLIPPSPIPLPQIDSAAIELAAVNRISLIRGPGCIGCEQNNGLSKLTIACSCRTCQAKKIATWTCPTGRWQKREAAWLRGYFDRIVVISLERTPGRLTAFREHIAELSWPLREVETFKAVDGTKEKPPEWWKEGGPAWGCLQSHRTVLEQAKRDGINRLLVMEDDAGFPDRFAEKLFHFLARVPGEYDLLLVGGQQMHDGFSVPVIDGVKRVSQCERTHCYALSREGIYALSKWWSEPTTGHADWKLGDFEAAPGVKAYRADPVISFQRSAFSTILYKQVPNRSWDAGLAVHARRPADVQMVRLNCSRSLASALRARGLIHSGGWRTSDDIDHGLKDLVYGPESARAAKFAEWSAMIRDEAAAFDNAVAVVWWPDHDVRVDKLCEGMGTLDGTESQFQKASS